MNRFLWISVLLTASACGGLSDVDHTVATLSPVRSGVTREGEPAAPTSRVAAGEVVATERHGAALLLTDSGTRVLLDESTEAQVIDGESIQLRTGRVYVQANAAQPYLAITSQGELRLRGGVSVRSAGEVTTVYVVSGEASYRAGDALGTVRAGERLVLGPDAPRTEAARLWRDWTGGLATPGLDAPAAAGVGQLEGRVPGESGLARWPLVVRRLDVHVRVLGDLAITEVEQVFFNPASDTVEGLYRIRVPASAVLQRFAVDRNGRLVDGYVREKAQARRAYEAQVYRGSKLDPALLEWVAPGSYKARIYPIAAGETRRIVIRYAEWLSRPAAGAPRLYRYPIGSGGRAPQIQEFALRVDLSDANTDRVRAGMDAEIDGDLVQIRRSDFRPQSDFWLELMDTQPPALRAARAPHVPPTRAPGSRVITNEADENDYWYLPLVLPESLGGDRRDSRGLDLVIVADVSAATDRSQLELGRTVVESITSLLGPEDRVAIVAGDLTIRSVHGESDPALGPAEPERIAGLLDGLARIAAGGASDLGATLAAAAGLLDPAQPGAVIYVGDGAPTVGELAADGLLEALARLPSPMRLYAIGVGADANLDLLEVLSRGGGLAMRVEQRAEAARAAMDVLAHAERPLAQRVTVDLGTGIDNAFPRRPVDVVLGAVLPVAGRVREGVPSTVTVRGTLRGAPFEHTLKVITTRTPATTDLRLRWAGERLRQLLLEGATREEVAELGTRYGMITPYTSYYVPSAQELGVSASLRHLIDQPLLRDLRDSERRHRALPLVASRMGLLPVLLSGCFSLAPGQDNEAPPEWVEPESDEASVARAAASTSTPTAPPPPQAAPGAAQRGPSPRGDNRGRDQNFPVEAEAAPGRPAGGAPDDDPAREQTRSAGALAAATGATEDSSGDAADLLVALDGTEHVELGVTGVAGQGAGGGGEGPIGRGSGYGRGGGDRLQASRSKRARRIRRPRRRRVGVSMGLGDEGGSGLRVGRHTLQITTVVSVHHRPQRCSDAAGLLLDDRRALWHERLGTANGVSAWVEVYRRAIRMCEAPTWRDRRAILALMIGRAGGIRNMTRLYQQMPGSSERGWLRRAILRRVRSADQLRIVRQVFGLSQAVDWALVTRVVDRAPNPRARVRELRKLIVQFPTSFDLKLRLLEELERAGRMPEAERLASRMRTDPIADAGVRTTIGEMYIRAGKVDEARRVFSEIVEFAPSDELARRRLGDLYRAHGWFEQAYRQYLTLSQIRPDDPSVSLLLAQAAAGAGRVDEALRLEQRLAETAEPGSMSGIARTAILWSSVRFAKLRQAARESGNADRLRALLARMRRSGVLREAGDFRATLTWSHPDARLGLWAAYPGLGLSRPTDIAPEFGIEALDVTEAESGTYKFEVRRSTLGRNREHLTPIEAELVLVWNEGRADELVRVIPLRFEGTRLAFAWTLTGRQLSEARPSAEVRP